MEPAHSVWFGVQICTVGEPLSPDSPELRGRTDATPYIRHGMHKYILGHHITPESAHEAKVALRADGFEGAFVVAFDGEDQIPMSQARGMTNPQMP